MATATTINGKPSVFLTMANPNPTTADYPTRINDFVGIATAMVTELATPEAEMTDEDWLNDPEFQAEYNEYLERLEREWRNDPKAQAEFDEWVTEQERIALETEGETTPEEEADLCNRYDAEADTYAELRCGAGHYFAGHDNAWQAGVNL